MCASAGANWETVSRFSKRCVRRRNLTRKFHDYLLPVQKSIEPTELAVISLKQALATSDFFKTVLAQLSAIRSKCGVDTTSITTSSNVPPSQFLALCCYGLGCGTGEVFILQLLCATLLRQELSIDHELTWVSDPAMDHDDVKRVLSFGLQADKSHLLRNTRQENSQEAGKPLGGPVITMGHKIQSNFSSDKTAVIILFMPHCDSAIYGAVLRKLLSQLKGRYCVILIGNDLRQYDRFHAAAIYRDNAYLPQQYTDEALYLECILPQLHCHEALPVYSPCPEAFSHQRISWLFSDKPS